MLASPAPSAGPAPDAPASRSAAEAALALAAEALGVSFAQLLRVTDHGPAAVATHVEGWSGDAPDLAGLAATLGEVPERFDIAAISAAGGTASGCRIGEAGVFVVADLDGMPRDAAWMARVRLAADSLTVHLAPPPDPTRDLLADLAGAPGSFPDRLTVALRRAATLVGLPAGALVRVEGAVWRPDAVWDPEATGLFDGEAPLAERTCRSTVLSDGPIGMHHTDEGAVRAYLGAPVCIHGGVFGTLCFAGATPRAEPFSDAERALATALARWAGHALEGRLAAEALATRQALLGTLYAHAPIGLGTVELVEDADVAADVRFLSANRALSDMMGTAAGTADGQTAEALGVSLRMRRLWTGACRRAHAGTPARRFEFSPMDGRTCAATIARVAGPGEPPRFVVVVEDVTAQRAATESLREEQAGVGTLLSHAAAFIATADLDGNVSSLRGRPASEGAATVFDLFPGSVPSGAALHRALGGEPAAWTAEVSGRTFHASAVPQRNTTGHRMGLTVVGLDVTAQVAAARAAADTDARAAAAMALRRALVANLAHELRTPLAALLGYADLLGDGLSGEELEATVAETSEVAARAGRRVLAAVDDLQELVLLGEERFPSAVDPSDVASVIAEAVEAYRPEAHALGVTVMHETDGLGGPLLLDPRLLGRSARQLLARALHSPGVVRTRVHLATGGEAVCLSVQHDGADQPDPVADEAADRLARAMGGVVRRDHVGERPRTRLLLPRRPVRLVDLDGSVPSLADALPAPAPPRPDREGARAETTPADDREAVTAGREATPRVASEPASQGDGAAVGRTLDLASLLSAEAGLAQQRDGEA